MSIIKTYLNKLYQSDEDPIDAAKSMISSIQMLVGIHDVFNDGIRRFNILHFIAMMTLGGTFFYVGNFSQLVYLGQVFPDKLETFKALNCISATTVPLSKYFFMWTAGTRLKLVMQKCHEGLSYLPKENMVYTNMMGTLRKARLLSGFVVANQTFTHVTYLLIPFVFTVFGTERYLPTTPGELFGFGDMYETPNYEITFAIKAFATAFSAVNQTGYIVLLVTLLAHELGHFYTITEMLKQIKESLTTAEDEEEINQIRDKEVREKLVFCVKHHQFTIKFHSEVRELYQAVFGAHFLMMTIVLVTTLQTMNSWDVRNTILTGFTGIMPLFIYCFGGELLISAQTAMSEGIYGCGWELMGVKHARIVLLMLTLSHRPLYLTAAGIFVMNRQTFANIAQMVYKIYAVFN